MARQIGDRWQANAYVDGRRVRLMFNTKQEADAYERNPARGGEKLPTVASFRMACEFLWRNTKNARTQYYNTEALIRRVSIQRIQKLLGHSTPLTTMRYAKLAEDDALGVSALLVRQPADRKSAPLPPLAIEAVRRPVEPLEKSKAYLWGNVPSGKGGGL